MRCFHPITVRGPDYTGPVPCGKCFACQSNRRKDWHMRIKYEMLTNLQSYTVTLTYDDDHLPSKEYFVDFDPLKNPLKHGFWYHPIKVEHVQLFFKRLRKSGLSFRYFGVGEYGGNTARPHYHIIFFFHEPLDKLRFANLVFKNWPYGIQIVIDDTNDDCIGYTLKYCLKMYNSINPSPKVFCSKRPFIGDGYMKDTTVKYLRTHVGDIVNTFNGTIRLPRIYRDKIYDDDMKELNKEKLLDVINSNRQKLEYKCSERGISVEDYEVQKRVSYTNKCIQSIKKKKF